MSRVLTNDCALAYALETTETAGSSGIGVLPGSPVWKTLEPNEISAFGATISTVARNPISRQRSARKGAVSDLDSSVEMNTDLTVDAIRDFVEGFCFSKGSNNDLIFPRAAATGTGYTIPAATAAQAGKIIFGANLGTTLVYASGYAIAGNNGLKAITADTATSGTAITVSGNTSEASPPANALLQVAGIRGETGDLAITVSGTTATITSTDNIFLNCGLVPGQLVHVGGLLVANQFSAGKGYGRIRTIAAGGGTIVLDKLQGTLATDTGSGETVDILFGQFIRDVETDNASFMQRSIQFEATFPGLGPSNETMFEYAKGNFCNELTVNMEVADKATIDLGFIGTDSEAPTTTRKTNAANPRTPQGTGAFGTSADILRLRITDVDEAGLTTDFKSFSLTINNNVSPEKVLANLGARFMNYGRFDVNFEAQALFTNGNVLARIRGNTTVTMDTILKNADDGVVAIDIPSLYLGDGTREFPLNETVLINMGGVAFKDATLGTAIGISTIPVVPA